MMSFASACRHAICQSRHPSCCSQPPSIRAWAIRPGIATSRSLLVDVQRPEDGEQHHGTDNADDPGADRAHCHDPERACQPKPELGADDPDDDIGDDPHLSARLHQKAGQPSDHSADDQGDDEAHSPSPGSLDRSNEKSVLILAQFARLWRAVRRRRRSQARCRVAEGLVGPDDYPLTTWMHSLPGLAGHAELTYWPSPVSRGRWHTKA